MLVIAVLALLLTRRSRSVLLAQAPGLKEPGTTHLPSRVYAAHANH